MEFKRINMTFPKRLTFMLKMLFMSKTFYFRLQISKVLDVELTCKIIWNIKMCQRKNFINSDCIYDVTITILRYTETRY